METIETKELSDNFVVAYLHLIKGFSIKPIKSNHSRLISFEVSGHGFDAAIQEFYGNPKIPIMDFVTAYKMVRNIIFNLKEPGARR